MRQIIEHPFRTFSFLSSFDISKHDMKMIYKNKMTRIRHKYHKSQYGYTNYQVQCYSCCFYYFFHYFFHVFPAVYISRLCNFFFKKNKNPRNMKSFSSIIFSQPPVHISTLPVDGITIGQAYQTLFQKLVHVLSELIKRITLQNQKFFLIIIIISISWFCIC